MKKIIIYLLLIIVFFVVPNNLKAEVSTYKVYVLSSSSEKKEEVEFDNYKQALDKMNSYPKDIDNIAVIEKNNTLVNAKYAVAKLKTNGYTYLYNNASLSGNYYTSISNNYGVDAAFIDYNNDNNTVKIKISGYTGWTSLDSINIIPLSLIATQHITSTIDGTVLRNDSTVNASVVRTLKKNEPFIWDVKKVIGDTTWYHINEYGTNGWISDNANTDSLIIDKKPNMNTVYRSFGDSFSYDSYYFYHLYAYISENKEGYLYNKLGPTPSIINYDQYYYSFDGNYFYNDYLTMIDDYKANVYTNSINPTNPYYNYYLYLPNHSKTGYTANDFNKIVNDDGYNIKPNPETNYVNPNGTWVSEYVESNGKFKVGVNRQYVSQMVNEGASFIESQELYGINALLTFGAAYNESAKGTSEIALAKNNIFGHHAVDSDPFNQAYSYTSVRESILAHARDYSGEYSNPSDWRYYGSHYGNKGSGMNVRYATDPYWGEKAAANAYQRDVKYGGLDYQSNTIGVKTTDEIIPLKKQPIDTSDTIYTVKNTNTNGNVFTVSNVPFIVIDKIDETSDKSWYKVYSDVALDDNQNITNDSYKFEKSFAYIRSDYLYVSNNQPTISASDIVIEQGTTYNFLTNVTASDSEDGDLTSKIKYSNIQTNIAGIFYLTYTVTDSMNYSVSKKVKVTIYESANKPVITAINKEVLQNTEFDPMNGVSANDPKDGNITNKIKIDYNNVDMSKVGEYKIVYSVTDSINITTIKGIQIKVLSNAKPILRVSDIYMNVNDNITFLENASAIDLEDGVISSKITLLQDIDKSKVGNYDLTYEVKDSNDNIVTKNVKVYIESNAYTQKKGELYFNSLDYNQDTDLFDISGSLAIIGIDNTKDTDIKYDLILKNNASNYEVVLPLERYLENHPTTVYGDTNFKYTETWFKGSVDLKQVIKGEYTLYIRARSGNYESKVLFNNLFLKPITKKATDSNGRGYLFRNNNYYKEFPMELFIYENGLITTTESPSTANMFNSYNTIDMKDKYLKITGNSFNIKGDYSEKNDVSRYLIFEDIITEKRYQYDIGSVVGSELILKSNDGLSKVKSWYDTADKVDITKLPIGRYIIYLRTSTGKVDDFGELQDIFLNASQSIDIDSKKYTLYVNKNNRFRVELIVE